MAGAVGELRIKGLPELERAFAQLRREVLLEIKPTLLELAKPVAADATRRADHDISNIGGRWDQFRIGVTPKGVYVAPKYRRRGGSPRRNLGPLLFKQMQDAADAGREGVVKGLDEMIGRAGRNSGFTTI